MAVAIYETEAQKKRPRIRPRPIQAQEPESEQLVQESEEDDRRPLLQYYRADPREDTAQQRILLVPANSGEDYDLYERSQPQQRPQQRVDIPRPQQRVSYQSTTVAPRRKDDNVSKAPPVQTIRNYSKVNDDGSFTFGYEAADGSFKEETRGTDCVVRGKYGYIDPDGNKREFTYVSGNPCDPNNPEGNDDEDLPASEEESNENVPQNYPSRRPVPRPQPVSRPVSTTARPPTTVFQNVYANQGLRQDEESEEEENVPQTINIGQRPVQRPTPRPVTQTTRQRVQFSTTPTPASFYQAHTQNTQPVSITPRPYKVAQTNPPATTYRPPVQIITQKAVQVTTPATFVSSSSTRGNIDFDQEFKNFGKDNRIQSTPKTPFKPSPSAGPATRNPIYETQLVYDPSTGQYNSALYQTLPQSEGDFTVNQRIQPYVHTAAAQPPQPSLVSLQQLRDQSPYYRSQIEQQQQPQPQVPQQIYQKQQSELQFLNSQQLFAQQLQQQQSQLQRDRVEAAKRAQPHRFEVRPAPVRLQQSAGQQYYYIQPSPNSDGQIDAFLRAQNLDF